MKIHEKDIDDLENEVKQLRKRIKIARLEGALEAFRFARQYAIVREYNDDGEPTKPYIDVDPAKDKLTQILGADDPRIKL